MRDKYRAPVIETDWRGKEKMLRHRQREREREREKEGTVDRSSAINAVNPAILRDTRTGTDVP